MRLLVSSILVLLALAGTGARLVAQRNAGGRPVHDETARLARWKEVRMPLPASGISAAERRMLDKLMHASALLDRLFWRQNDLGGYELYRRTQDPAVRTLLGIMGQRWDVTGDNWCFVGEFRMPPGHDLYPHDLTRAEVDRWVAQHPEDRAVIFAPDTVVVKEPRPPGSGSRLVAIPYHQEYRRWLEPMAKDLRDAAALSPDPAFANYLKLRADALLTGDYHASELTWLDLKNPKFDLIFAPYQSDIDGLLGVKSAYTAAVLIRNEAESRKLAEFQKFVPDLQDVLPVAAEARPSRRGHVTPMEVMDAPYRAGDLGHGYQAVADTLPDDPRIHEEKGTKKIFFRNFMDARVREVVMPLARQMMDARQAGLVSAEGYLFAVLLHEISHDLGPSFARIDGKDVPIGEAIGPAYGALEEAKADIVGMFGLKWLTDRGALPAARLEEFYASFVAGIFRTVRYGTGESHARAEMAEFNYLREQNAVTLAGGKCSVDTSRMTAAIGRLARELLETEAAGDRARAEGWFKKYGAMPADLKTALAAAASVPVEIYPLFTDAVKVEP
jgi:hypothetical protein